MVNVLAIPEGLENGVGKSEYQDILNGFLAEVVIDSVDLALVENFADKFVQLGG